MGSTALTCGTYMPPARFNREGKILNENENSNARKSDTPDDQEPCHPHVFGQHDLWNGTVMLIPNDAVVIEQSEFDSDQCRPGLKRLFYIWRRLDVTRAAAGL